jgi:hypothetical protein
MRTFNIQHSTSNTTLRRYGMLTVERWMFDVLLCALLLCFAPTAPGNGSAEQPTVIIAVGAAGEEDFGKEFAKWTESWTKTSEQAGVKHLEVGLAQTNATTDLSLLKQSIANEPTNSAAELWIILIGHGTYDGKEARFNLRGPDLSAKELADWLKPFRRPVIVIDCASSSSPFLNKLSAPGRVIVTATRSGHEENYARFGQFIAKAIADPAADLDKDGQTSLLEAFIMASRQVGEFYEAEGRLATEHALLDDNGDGLGTSADFFRGVRAVKKPVGGGSVDGLRAHQIHLVRSEQEQRMSTKVRERRDELELAIARLRDTKDSLPSDEYYRRLEQLMLELAKLYSSQ